MAITASESQPPPTSAPFHHHSAAPPPEVESAQCASCGFTEDCTPAYIARVRDRHHGRWVCGLCAEAVKDEATRGGGHAPISGEEALNRHITFFEAFRSERSSCEHPISAIGRVLRRRLESPRTALRSNSDSSLGSSKAMDSDAAKNLVRSGSCFSSFSGRESQRSNRN